MPNGIDDYFILIHQPWGRMFYDILWNQLCVSENPRLKILDFGSGFGITANHYAKHHEVTAIEPDTQMYGKRFCDNEYMQITGGIEKLTAFPDGVFDAVFCHNVLEYIKDQEIILIELARVLKTDGFLSIVKHNVYGRIAAAAVFDSNPQKALDLLKDMNNDRSSVFGNRYLYTEEDLLNRTEKCNLKTGNIFGIRTFFALSQNNDIKYDSDWYKKMLELELTVSDMDEYKTLAFFNHLIFRKQR